VTIDELLRANKISIPSTAPGRYYTTCPQCSHKRSKEHQRSRVLGVTVDGKSAHWGCNHCDWTGPAKGSGTDRRTDDVITYDYTDEMGELLFQKVRSPLKKFWQRRPDGRGGWINGLGKTRKVLYRLPEVNEAIAAGHTVFCVEGEKDADNLWRINVPATCNPDGAAELGQRPKWRAEYSEMLRGADVVVIGDNDSPGRAHVEATASMCGGIAARVRVLELAMHWPAIPKGGDISDWLVAGHGREEFDALVERAAADSEPSRAHGRQKRKKQSQASPEDSDPSRPPLTDLGNARRFVLRHGENFRSCPVIGWLAWAGNRWSVDAAEGLLDKGVHDTIEAIANEAPGDETARWAEKSQGACHVGCVSKLARPYLEISASQFDADPFKINVRNGTLIVQRGNADSQIITKEHDRADLITKMAPVIYDPQATCPTYDRFLAEVQPDEKVRRFLHQWGGLSLTGDVSEQRMVVFWGKGANGKSTLLESWANVAGDYGMSIAVESFLDQGRARRGGEPTPDLAMLTGVRFLRTSEPERGAKLGESLIKVCTGGDALRVRHLNRDFFELRPEFKLVLSGNYRPQIRGADEGIWRRVVLVPWTVTIPLERRDPLLLEKLHTEASGIFNRLLDGLCDWMDNGLVVPDDVKVATAAYRADSDPLGRFLAAKVSIKPGERVQSSILYAVYSAWTKENGVSEWTQTGFSSAMVERGYKKKQSDVMWWLDIVLTLQEAS